MKQHTMAELDTVTTLPFRIKTIERECPKCESVLVHNDNEMCYECLNCGYIDCGEDD